MSMREGKSVKAYFERYWEMFSKIDGDFDEIAVKTFKVGLPSEHGLRKSLTGKPVTSLRQLMDQLEISGWIDTTITDREGIMRINQGLTVLRPSVRCSESQCIKY